jgi:hypothetical protein
LCRESRPNVGCPPTSPKPHWSGIKKFSDLHSQGLTPARLVLAILWLDCACQGCPYKTQRFARDFLFCGSTLTVLVEPGTWLVRKARRDFQPEFSTIRFKRKLSGKTASSQPQEKNFKIHGLQLYSL